MLFLKYTFSVQEDVAVQLRKTIKKLYDITKSLEASSGSEALSELIVDNFDDEQVWQEIELQNEPVIVDQIKQISRVTASSDSSFSQKRRTEQDVQQIKKLKKNPDAFQKTDIQTEYENINVDDEDEEDEEDMSEDEREMEELLKRAKEELDNASGDDDDDDDDGSDDLNDNFDLNMDNLKEGSSSKDSSKSVMKKRTSVVDDRFFKLVDLETFLDQEDAKEERKLSGQPEPTDEDLNYFTELPSDEENEVRWANEVSLSERKTLNDFINCIYIKCSVQKYQRKQERDLCRFLGLGMKYFSCELICVLILLKMCCMLSQIILTKYQEFHDSCC